MFSMVENFDDASNNIHADAADDVMQRHEFDTDYVT